MNPRALVTGITGQDGAHMAKLLLSKGYYVYGLHRRSATPDFWRLKHVGVLNDSAFILVEGDLTDPGTLTYLMRTIKPDEVYNLAAQSHVGVSFKEPVHTTRVNYIGVLHLIDAILSLPPGSTRLYQACTSEMFGCAPAPQHEGTPFWPRSPYAVAKLAAYWAVCQAREAHGLHASNGILFNHEGEYRGKEFVTRKITSWVANRKKWADKASVQAFAEGEVEPIKPLRLGNLNAFRDWGYAEDYVEGMYLMVQKDKPGDYVLGTGTTRTVRDFVEAAFKEAFPESTLVWEGSGKDEVGKLDGDVPVVVVDSEFYRPLEVDRLCADATKARTELGWEPKTSFDEMVARMVRHDLESLE